MYFENTNIFIFALVWLDRNNTVTQRAKADLLHLHEIITSRNSSWYVRY
jgi:hypothetical protein